MRVLVTGDRNWKDIDYNIMFIVLEGIKALCDQYDEILYVIEGGAKGADAMAKDWAKPFDDVEVITEHAEWDKYGLAAGPIRNRKMIDEHEPELVLAFHDDLSQSKGTKDCVMYAVEQGIPVYHIASYTKPDFSTTA